MSYDQKNDLKQVVALTTSTISSDTATNGAIIDTMGYKSVTIFLQAGVVTTGDITLTSITESNDSGMAGATTMASEQLIGLPADTKCDATGETSRIGCLPRKRYIRAVYTSANTASLVISSLAVLGRPEHAVVA